MEANQSNVLDDVFGGRNISNDSTARGHGEMMPPSLSGPLQFMPPLEPAIKMLSDVVFYLQMYYNPALASVGMIANILCCVVLAFSNLYKLSAGQYLLGIAVADTLFLVNILLHWLNIMGYSVYQYGSLCHFTMFLKHASSFLSLWYVVCLAVDGFIIVCCPYKRERFCSIARARIIVLTLAVIAIAVFLNISLTFGVINIGQIYLCHPVHTLADPLSKLQKVDVFINGIIPYSCLIYLLLHTAIQCACQRKQGVTTYSTTRGGTNPENIVYPLKFYFLYLVTVLLLNLPAQCLRVYNTLKHITRTSANRPNQTQQLWQDTMDNLQNMRYIMNFWILLLTSEYFRQGVVFIIVRMGASCKRNASSKSPDGQTVLPDGHTSDETSLALIESNAKSVAAV